MLHNRNILVFPGGSEIGLEIRKSLGGLKNMTLFSAGDGSSNHAPYVYSDHSVLPSIYEENFTEELNKLIKEKNIDYVFPAYDDVILHFAKIRDDIDAVVLMPSTRACEITRYKSKTYEELKDVIGTPKSFPECGYPVFIKPDRGQGSQGTRIVYEGDLNLQEGEIAIEYLPGKEYTVDCFSDREEGLKFCLARERVRTKAGISMHSIPSNSITVNNSVRQYARDISEKLNMYGAWFFQIKLDKDDNIKLMEIAPRIAGTSALCRGVGVNLALLTIYEAERTPLTMLFNGNDIEIDRAFKNSFKLDINYDTVYIDFDDTLEVNGKINTDLVKFIYQCINNKKKVVLLTKHKENIHITLKKYRLSGLFDGIIWLPKSSKKSDFISTRNSIFIDDSFKERKDVKDRWHIPVFDNTMLEALIEDKE